MKNVVARHSPQRATRLLFQRNEGVVAQAKRETVECGHRGVTQSFPASTPEIGPPRSPFLETGPPPCSLLSICWNRSHVLPRWFRAEHRSR